MPVMLSERHGQAAAPDQKNGRKDLSGSLRPYISRHYSQVAKARSASDHPQRGMLCIPNPWVAE